MRVEPARPTSAADAPSLARIAGGEYTMGASDADPDERPAHRVYVSEFYIGRFAVTHDDYARFVRATGYPAPSIRGLPLIAASGRDSLFKEMSAPYVWERSEPPPGHGAHPVVLVRYDDALAYCRWLSEVLGRIVRLPTEAEWEKAARGGEEGQRYPWGSEIDPSRCNYLVEPALKRQRGTRPTGTFPANQYGLYDIIGNVWEWVSDWYDATYYSDGDVRDPRGPASGNMRIVRGGSWVNDDASMLTSGYRHQVPPDTYAYSVGFRIVCPA